MATRSRRSSEPPWKAAASTCNGSSAPGWSYILPTPPPSNVLLRGVLAFETLLAQGRAASFAAAAPQAGCRFFAETSQNLCEPFLSAWRAQGLEQDGQPGFSEAESLALFGLPLGSVQPEQLSDGNSYAVQWFERARFELHPANPPQSQVRFGLLGSALRPQHPAQCCRSSPLAPAPFSRPQMYA
ncbi:hypothetical protein HC891_17560 [Candidatus Gracilibacteria bacterium]|nr:hypothetical protein [Candidatus Gracilibacteria bacterium]